MSIPPRPHLARPGPSLTAHKQARKTAANIRGRPGSDAPAATATTGGLRAVPDEADHAPAVLPASATRRVTHDGAPPVVAAVKVETRQYRGSAKKVLDPLKFDSQTPLVTYLDVAAGHVWIQRAVLPASHDTDGTPCECGRCVEHTAQPPTLPGELVRAQEQAAVTAEFELQLGAGLCGHLGVAMGAQVVATAVRELDALLVVSPRQQLHALLASTGQQQDNPHPARDREPDHKELA